MPKVTINGTVVAESDRCERVEGNYYFPPEAIARDYFQPSSTHTTCPWKGQADYYNLVVDGETIQDAAWIYPQTKERAKNIEGYIAFYRRKVQIED